MTYTIKMREIAKEAANEAIFSVIERMHYIQHAPVEVITVAVDRPIEEVEAAIAEIEAKRA